MIYCSHYYFVVKDEINSFNATDAKHQYVESSRSSAFQTMSISSDADSMVCRRFVVSDRALATGGIVFPQQFIDSLCEAFADYAAGPFRQRAPRTRG